MPVWSRRIFPSLPDFRLMIFYRDTSSALVHSSTNGSILLTTTAVLFFSQKGHPLTFNFFCSLLIKVALPSTKSLPDPIARPEHIELYRGTWRWRPWAEEARAGVIIQPPNVLSVHSWKTPPRIVPVRCFLSALAGRKQTVVVIDQFSFQKPPVSRLWSSLSQKCSAPPSLARRQSNCPPPSPNLVLTTRESVPRFACACCGALPDFPRHSAPWSRGSRVPSPPTGYQSGAPCKSRTGWTPSSTLPSHLRISTIVWHHHLTCYCTNHMICHTWGRCLLLHFFLHLILYVRVVMPYFSSCVTFIFKEKSERA